MKHLFQLIVCICLSYNLFGQSQHQSNYSIGITDTIFSIVLNESREIFIYVPHGFWGLDEDITNSPVTIVLDGESQFLQTVGVIDYLSSAPMGNDHMPRSIVVGIPNTNRARDFTPYQGTIGSNTDIDENSGGGVQFLEFITSELIPYIDSTYSTIPKRTLIGHSLGGLVVFEALLHKRDFFDNYLAIDPALDFDRNSFLNTVLDTLRHVDLSSENLFVATASRVPPFLIGTDIKEDTSQIMNMPLVNQEFLNYSLTEHWNINHSCIEYPKEDHFSIPYPATYDAMNFFYSYFPFDEIVNYYHPSYTDSDLVQKLKLHYQNISEHLGTTVVPMESYLNSWGFGIAQFGRPDLALDMLNYSIELYPNHASTYISKGNFLIGENREQEAIQAFEKSLRLEQNEYIIRRIKELKSN